MNIQMLPLNRLVPSPANVRKTGAALGIDELAASIAAHGLLQNLQVRTAPKGKFEVVAGGRRLAALKLLVKQGALAKDADIGCHVLDAEDAAEISLAENTVRLAMHPADQFEAFQALAATGKGPEDIAARFGVSPAVVRQRLKLASVSPKLIALYRDEQMSLDCLMAFTVSDDIEAQEAAWFDQPRWAQNASSIRNTLTAAHVEADDPRVLFIGIEAYKMAGGGILRDLFEEEHEGYLTDTALLDRLVAAKLDAEAEAIRAEGWKWVEAVPQFDFDRLRIYGRVKQEPVPLPPEQQEQRDRLSAEYDALLEACGDDPDAETAVKLDDLAALIDLINDHAFAWRTTDLPLSGAIVSIASDGKLDIKRGLVRPEDKVAFRAASKPQAAGTEVDAAPPLSPLSATLVEELTAERTAALRATLGENKAVALAAVAHALALPVFYPHAYRAESCLDVRLKHRDLRCSGECIAESGAAVLLQSRQAAWEKRLPEEAEALFDWLLAQDSETVTGLITFSAAMSIDAIQTKQDRPDAPRLTHAAELAAALSLDMAAWWEPTKERYLGRVSRKLVLDPIAEGVSPSAAENLDTIKTKAELVDRAAERLAGKGWLPAPLRPKAAPKAEADAILAAAE